MPCWRSLRSVGGDIRTWQTTHRFDPYAQPSIRALNRVLYVGEPLRHALHCLAIVAPDWLRAHSQPEWVERDIARMEDERTPLGQEALHAYAEVIGTDGASLASRDL